MLAGIGIVAAIIVVAILWEKLKSKATSAAATAVNKRVHAKANAEGADLLDSPVFYAIKAPADQVMAAVWGGVKAKDRAPRLGMADTYRVLREPTRLTWRHGALEDLFTASAMHVNATMEDGTSQAGMVLVFSDGTVADGQVTGVGAMKAIRSDVLAALRSLDPAVEGIAV